MRQLRLGRLDEQARWACEKVRASSFAAAGPDLVQPAQPELAHAHVGASSQRRGPLGR
eukprot:NODE_6212_length_645_cov_10.753356_g5283_i0.p3 GENE.NODE_6212_length_645_cov_10.753356_g5283_i0~~NODE_6212_length_645_cov_10.753356_g5283_i0.p3  ORF type:complete len:58 (+),score=10.59 NODE_6212_length_645_cov_10.753356_g5283_i0:199-372(+)